MTQSAYPALTTAQSIFKQLVWDPMIKGGEVALAGLEAPIPILNLPIVQGVEDDIIEIILNSVFRNLVMTVDIEAIRFVNSHKQAVYDSAFEQLAVLADEKGADSDEFKSARANALADLASFGHMGG